MIKARTWFTLLSFSIGTIALTFGCGSDEATGGGGGASGTGGGGIIGASGKGGAVSRAGAGGGTSTTSALGAMCAVDADCGTGFTCLTAASDPFVDGGPSSQGFCTQSCTGNAQCTALEPNAACINMGTANDKRLFCLEACTLGMLDPSADISTKCQGRFDVACIDLSDPTKSTTPAPFCVPRCSGDFQCDKGLFCDTRLGLCTKTKPKGDPAGTPCDPMAATNNCAGFCLSGFDTANTVGFCSDFCSGESPCGGTGTAPGGLCVGQFTADAGPLDLGFCETNCSCDSDCKFPTDVCRGWMASESNLQTLLGAPGLCFPPQKDGSVELTCGEAGAAGAGGAAAGGAAAGGAAAGGAAAGGAPAGGAPAGGGGATAVSGGGSGG